MHFIKRKPDSDEEDEVLIGYGTKDKCGSIRRDKPLRGYLDERDYELLQGTKQFLYGEYDLDRMQEEVQRSLSNNPGKNAIDRPRPAAREINKMFDDCREYQKEIKKIKKDVTYTESQQKALTDLDLKYIKAANDWVDFEDDDEEVQEVTTKYQKELALAKKQEMKELSKEENHRRSVLILRNSKAIMGEEKAEKSKAKSRIGEKID